MYLDNIKIGADPELFIINTKTGKVVSSVGLIPGEKGKPYISEDMPEGFGLETDNILAEFNIPPVTDKLSFLNALNYMKNYIRDYVKKINPDYDIKCSASEDVDEDQLNSDQARLFGCDVDYNAYTESPNPKPDGERGTLRSAGFHIHVSYDNPNIDDSLRLIKYLDMYVGLPSVLYDVDTRRRSLYGKAGSFRLPQYGCEFRTLSSAMYATDELISIVWDGIMKAIDACNSGYRLAPEELVQKAINNSNAELASKIINTYHIL